jgi:glycerol-3-phosphate dehydrogenase
MPDVIAQACGPHQLCGVLSGPSFAREIVAGDPTGLVIASRHPEVSTLLRRALHGEAAVRVWGSEDVIGVSVGGALKNVYAIGAGMVEGAGFGCAVVSLTHLLTHFVIKVPLIVCPAPTCETPTGTTHWP